MIQSVYKDRRQKTFELVNITRHYQYVIKKRSKKKERNDDDEETNFSYFSIWKLKCRNCNLKYVRQSSRRLKDTILSLASDIRLSRKSCDLEKKCIELGHIANFENFSILSRKQFV